MKKQSTNLSKITLGLILALKTQVFAKNSTVSIETLVKNNIEPQTISELLSEEILLKSKLSNYLILNEIKISRILDNSEDIELKQYMSWLKLIARDSSVISTKESIDMTLSSQDGGDIK